MRDWMSLDLTRPVELSNPRSAPAPCPRGRPPAPSDADALAQLMLDAYRGTTDDSGESIDDARAEVAKLLGGAFGPLDAAVSLVIPSGLAAGSLDSATILTRDATRIAPGEAFLAFSMTAPHAKRLGLARAGLLHAIHILRARAEPRLHLVVTRANTPAVRLYQSLGFVTTDRRP